MCFFLPLSFYSMFSFCTFLIIPWTQHSVYCSTKPTIFINISHSFIITQKYVFFRKSSMFVLSANVYKIPKTVYTCKDSPTCTLFVYEWRKISIYSFYLPILDSRISEWLKPLMNLCFNQSCTRFHSVSIRQNCGRPTVLWSYKSCSKSFAPVYKPCDSEPLNCICLCH